MAMGDQRKIEGTVVFSVVGRPNYGFDVFTIDLPSNLSAHSQHKFLNDHILTDAESINYNAQFVSPSDAKLLLLQENVNTDIIPNEEEEMIVYVSERTGNARIHFGSSSAKALGPLPCMVSSSNNVGFFFDRPAVKNGKAEDGLARRIVAEGGGWPTWADENTVYFHKKAEDGWWSIYRLKLPSDPETIQEPIKPERVTPPSIHAFTPCASATGNWIAVATRRPETKFRHIEIFDLGSESFMAVTGYINPEIHHYNPFVSSDHYNPFGC